MGEVMRILYHAFLAVFYLGAAVGTGVEAQAQTVLGFPTIALKSGETTEVGTLYWVSNCRSILTGTPEAEVLDGPPQMTVAVKQEMVLPRRQNCAKRVSGGTLLMTAKEIEDPSYSHVTIRINFKTKDGDRKVSQVFNVRLLP
jgi:hypothetical protein